MSISMLFLILALIAFILACIPIPTRINLIALGLAFWVLSILVAGGGLALR